MSRRIHADTHGFRILFAPINRIFICSPYLRTQYHLRFGGNLFDLFMFTHNNSCGN